MGEFIKNVLRPLKVLNKFPEYINPPKNIVFRGMSNLSLKTATKILGISEKELISMSGVSQKIAVSSTVYPINETMSWSSNKDIPTAFSYFGGNGTDETHVSIIMLANLYDSGNDFYLNINNIAQNYSGFPSLAGKEGETLSIGPVKIHAAYVYVVNLRKEIEDERKSFSALLPELISKISAEEIKKDQDESESAKGNKIIFNKLNKAFTEIFQKYNLKIKQIDSFVNSVLYFISNVRLPKSSFSDDETLETLETLETHLIDSFEDQIPDLFQIFEIEQGEIEKFEEFVKKN